MTDIVQTEANFAFSIRMPTRKKVCIIQKLALTCIPEKENFFFYKLCSTLLQQEKKFQTFYKKIWVALIFSALFSKGNTKTVQNKCQCGL